MKSVSVPYSDDLLYLTCSIPVSAESAPIVVRAPGPLAGVPVRHVTAGTPDARGLVPAREVHHARARVAVIAKLPTHLPALLVGP